MFFVFRWKRMRAVLVCIAAVAALWSINRAFGQSVLSLKPVGVRDVLLPMSVVKFIGSQPLKEARVRVSPEVPGEVALEGRSVAFIPHSPMRPAGVYHFEVSVTAADGRTLGERFAFRVEPFDDELWVYVRLKEPPHRVYVLEKDEIVRTMTASGGRPGYETPAGVFRIQNRGLHFWSQKYQEGAYYWVRIFGNYLFHSVPVDIEGNVIPEEAEKLGCPASHGCIRMSMEDAKWFYENVPDGTVVVIERI